MKPYRQISQADPRFIGLGQQQLKLKDQKIDHITFMAERSDEELITIRARVAELEAVLRECR